MSPMIKGLYINLDRKPERRRRMEAELRRFRLSQFYQRVRAVDGHAIQPDFWGATMGCFRSHLKAVEIARDAGGIVHIMEDDRLLSGRLRSFLQSPQCQGLLRTFDLVFLDMWVDPGTVEQYRQALAAAAGGLNIVNLRGLRVGSAASYLVSGRSAGRIAELLAAEAERGPRVPVDDFYSRMVQTADLKAAVILPFLTCMDMETATDSAIQIRGKEYMTMQVLMRTAFFVERERQASAKLVPASGPDQ